MARAFRRRADGYDVRLDTVEAQLVAELARDLLRLLDDEPAGDEVIARLFPDGYRDDPDAAAELRALIHGELREGKRASLHTLVESLADRDDRGRLHLDAETAEVWLVALNDLRLALGTRLQVTEDPYDAQLEGLPDDDPARHAMAVYAWLGLLQEGLVEALLPSVQP